jgi:WD40 repeat protein
VVCDPRLRLPRCFYGEFQRDLQFTRTPTNQETFLLSGGSPVTQGTYCEASLGLWQILTLSRKVGHVSFNPSAANVLASSSADFTVKLWDIEQSKDSLVLKHSEGIQSLSWSANGALLVTTCRDKKLRVWDVRTEKPVIEVAVCFCWYLACIFLLTVVSIGPPGC